MASIEERVQNAQTVVVKIGTSSLVTMTESNGTQIDITTLSRHVQDIAQLWRAGKEVVVVTSGAAGLGRRPELGDDISLATMRGQYRLMDTYADLFMEHGGIEVGQLVVTKRDLKSKKERKRMVRRISRGFSQEDTIVVVNENDAVTHKRVTFGDNDMLASHLALLLRADLLVMLSREDSSEGLGRGGEDAKRKALRFADGNGIVPLVVNGKGEHVIGRLFEGPETHVLKEAIRTSERIMGRRIHH